MIHEITLSIDEICEWIPDDSDQQLTRSILEMFEKYDLIYKINTDDERLRIYCYIKKSKETLIINTEGYRYGELISRCGLRIAPHLRSWTNTPSISANRS